MSLTSRHIPFHAFVDVSATALSIPLLVAVTSTKTPSSGHAFELAHQNVLSVSQSTAQVLFFWFAVFVFLGPRAPVFLGLF
ncbi:hypothetical protein EDB89DRAFT_779695 [Lactarius sanguifluus]|nr:hypothetical protein EDB89DRAFT_779695 [Lactarius sanguifluus]